MRASTSGGSSSTPAACSCRCGTRQRAVTTYGGGRYLLDTAKGAWHGGSLGGDADRLVLDLNFAYHPSCRYDPAWRCPLAPAGNTIDVAVGVGEVLA